MDSQIVQRSALWVFSRLYNCSKCSERTFCTLRFFDSLFYEQFLSNSKISFTLYKNKLSHSWRSGTQTLKRNHLPYIFTCLDRLQEITLYKMEYYMRFLINFVIILLNSFVPIYWLLHIITLIHPCTNKDLEQADICALLLLQHTHTRQRWMHNL